MGWPSTGSIHYGPRYLMTRWIRGIQGRWSAYRIAIPLRRYPNKTHR